MATLMKKDVIRPFSKLFSLKIFFIFVRAVKIFTKLEMVGRTPKLNT